MSVSESMYLSTGRRPSELASRTQKCAACISSSSIASTQWTTSAPSTLREHPGHEVHALEHERPALLERPLDQRRARRSGRSGSARRTAEHVAELAASRHLEAGAVDRRHEVLGQERAHRLADEVGRADARDPEPIGDLGRDRRLAGAGRAADQQDERQVELAQRARSGAGGGAPARPRARRAPRCASSSSRSRSTGASPRRRGRPRRAARARTRGRPARRSAISARAMRPFEYGRPSAAERQRVGAAALRHRPEFSPDVPRPPDRDCLVEAVGDDVVACEHERSAALAAASATTSIAAAFSSTR